MSGSSFWRISKRKKGVRENDDLVLHKKEREGAGTEALYNLGLERGRRRDPLSYVTESFRMNFDRIGQKHAMELFVEGEVAAGQPQVGQSGNDGGGTFSYLPGGRIARQLPEGLSVTGQPFGRERGGMPGESEGALPHASPLSVFSEMAFQRGGLSASVIAGTGKLMLVSCLKRSIGQARPAGLEEETFFGGGSKTRNIPARDPDQAKFNISFCKTAIGLVIDTVRDARKAVDDLAILAGDLDSPGTEEGAMLRRMYPFLDDGRERMLENAYRERLRGMEGGLGVPRDTGEHAMLQNALLHVTALREKKAQMKNEFINKLRLISDRAGEALEELERPGAEDEILREAFPEDAMPQDAPPRDAEIPGTTPPGASSREPAPSGESLPESMSFEGSPREASPSGEALRGSPPEGGFSRESHEGASSFAFMSGASGGFLSE